jgi:hypothetical protein
VIDLAVAVIMGRHSARSSIAGQGPHHGDRPRLRGLDFRTISMLGNPPAGYNGPMTYEALTKPACRCWSRQSSRS